MTEFEQALESAVKTAEYVGDNDVMLISSALVIECAEMINQQAAQIEALRTGDPCGRSCEGQAYRIEARQEKARADELQKEVEALTAERHRGLSLDALNKRIDSYFA